MVLRLMERKEVGLFDSEHLLGVVRDRIESFPPNCREGNWRLILMQDQDCLVQALPGFCLVL